MGTNEALPKIILERRDYGDQGTFGRIEGPGFSFFTGELPWRENKNDISCIPLGIYKATFTYSPRFRRRLYLLTPVCGRTGIRIHAANLMGDLAKGFKCQLNGCIAFGEKLGWISGQKAVLVSAPAHRKFDQMMGGNPFILEIVNA